MFRVDCIVCGKSSGNEYPLCNSCAPPIINLNSSCSKCGIETSEFVDKCPKCEGQDSSCIKNYSLFSYQGLSKEILREFKFSKDYRYAKFYGELIITYIKNNFNNPIIIPIPTSYIKKVLKNGYQLDPIVNYIKKNSNIKVSSIIGKRLSKTQKKLNRSERIENLKSSFYLKKRVPVKSTLILLDDVYTTGSTIESASKIIEEYNKTIYSITLAHD